MIGVRMGKYKIIQFLNTLFLQVILDLCAYSINSAVDQHRMITDLDQRRISLPDINEVHLHDVIGRLCILNRSLLDRRLLNSFLVWVCTNLRGYFINCFRSIFNYKVLRMKQNLLHYVGIDLIMPENLDYYKD